MVKNRKKNSSHHLVFGNRPQTKNTILTAVQVHSKDGAGACRKGDADEEHLHEQVHLDDPVPGLVLVRVDVLPIRNSLVTSHRYSSNKP